MRRAYEERLRCQNDEINARVHAINKEIAIGEKQGSLAKAREAAKNFLSAGIDASIVASSLGLSIDEVLAFKRKQ